jgi:hypothetical protein
MRVETKYDDWEQPRIEAQTAKYKDLLDRAAMDRNQVQMDKVCIKPRFVVKPQLQHSLVIAGCSSAVLRYHPPRVART